MTEMRSVRPSLARRTVRLLAQGVLFASITFAIGEVATRLVLGIKPLTPASVLFEGHPRWGWRHRPGGEDTFVKLAVDQPIRINSRGLREREIPYERAPGRYRILVIGDSSVVGFEVAAEDVFTRVAERFLVERGHSVEVINGGHRGFGTDQAYLFLVDEGLRYQPDLVIYKWTQNDLDDNMTVHRPFRRYGKSYFELDGDGELRLRGAPVPQYPYATGQRISEEGSLEQMPVGRQLRLEMWLRDQVVCRSSFAVALVHVFAAVPQLWARAGSHTTYGDFRDGKPKADPDSRSLRVASELVRAMERASREAGAAFGFLFPPGDPYARAIQETTGVRDLSEAYAAYLERRRGKKVQVPFDPHMNELGHRLLGQSLAETLLRGGLLPEAAATRGS